MSSRMCYVTSHTACNYERAPILLYLEGWIKEVLLYRSLAKKGPWVKHLTSLPKRGVDTLSTVSAFNHVRAPMSCDLKPLTHIFGHKIMYNRIIGGFEVKS